MCKQYPRILSLWTTPSQTLILMELLVLNLDGNPVKVMITYVLSCVWRKNRLNKLNEGSAIYTQLHIYVPFE